MSRQGKVIVIALAATVVVAVVAAIVVIPRLFPKQIQVTAHFEDAIGLYTGNTVDVLGMPVGKVTSVAAKDSYVEVKLAIDKKVDIPADAMAVTFSQSILTDRHVELTPPYRGGPKMKDGDLIGLGRTRTPVEFDRTLQMVDKLGSALRGDEQGRGPLGDLVNLGAQVATHGPDIKATLDKLSAALRVGDDKGARSKKNIQEIVTALSELTQAAAENDAAIRQFGSNVRQLTDILAAEDLGSGTTGATANRLLAEMSRILEGNRDALKDTVANGRAITTTLTDNRRELAETLDVAPLTVDNIYNIIDPVAGSARAHALADKVLFNSQLAKEMCNLMGLKQLGCATGTPQDYGPDFGLTSMLDLMANGIGSNP